MYAAEKGNVECLTVLIAHGADVHVKEVGATLR